MTAIETEYYSVEMVPKKSLNTKKCLEKINEYLGKNLIAGEEYEAFDVRMAENDVVHVILERKGEYLIDEDFSKDDQWEAFCNDMASKLDVRLFTVPWWCSPK